MNHQGTAKIPTQKDGERKCTACNLTFPDIYAYADHLESKEHISGVMKKKYGEKYLEAKAKFSDLVIEGSKPDSDDDTSDDDGEVYTCEVCQKVCTGLLSYRLHLSGKKHQKNIKKSKLLKQMKKDKIIPDESSVSEDNPLMDAICTPSQFSASEIFCKVCKKKCTGPESYKAHRNSESHKKKLVAQNLVIEDTNRNNESNDDEESTEFAHCGICNKGFSGPLPYKQHIDSQSHLKQVKQSRKMNKFKDLFEHDEDSKIKCKECNKLFTGPKPFQDHLNSSSHMKQKKRMNLIKDLKEKCPDMIIKSGTTGLNSDDSDNDLIICCNTCHRAFSGPESAKDHFMSRNHKKAKKQKIRLEKLKCLNNSERVKTKSANDAQLIKGDKREASNSDSSESFQILDDDRLV